MGSSPGYLSSYRTSFEPFPQLKDCEKKSAVKQKNPNLIGSFSALGEISNIRSKECHILRRLGLL